MTDPQTLPVIRVERLDGTHEHPVIREMRSRIEELEAVLADCIVVLNGCEPKDNSRLDYYKKIISEAYRLLDQS